MRISIYAEIDNLIDALHLDIIDDRPCRDVLKDLVILGEMSPDDGEKWEQRFSLFRASTELNLENTLAENDIRNGDVIRVLSKPSIAKSEDTQLFNDLEDDLIETEKLGGKDSYKQEHQDLPKIPGKKIDFD